MAIGLTIGPSPRSRACHHSFRLEWAARLARETRRQGRAGSVHFGVEVYAHVVYAHVVYAHVVFSFMSLFG